MDEDNDVDYQWDSIWVSCLFVMSFFLLQIKSMSSPTGAEDEDEVEFVSVSDLSFAETKVQRFLYYVVPSNFSKP